MTQTLLREVQTRGIAAGRLITWARTGRRPVTVRALRGDQWFPQTPDDHADGSYGARLIYEGKGSGFVDTEPMTGAEAYYSLFSRRGEGPWSRAVNVRVTVHDEAAAEDGEARPGRAAAPVLPSAAVYDSRQAVGRGNVGREVLAVVCPTVFTVALTVALLTAGWAERVALAAAWVLIAVWRRTDPDSDDEAFAKWLVVPVAIVGVAALAKVTMAFRLPWDEEFFGRADIIWFLLTVAGTAGAWLLAGRALTVARRPARLALLAAPAVLALIWPPAAAIALSAYVVVDAVGRRADGRRS